MPPHFAVLPPLSHVSPALVFFRVRPILSLPYAGIPASPANTHTSLYSFVVFPPTPGTPSTLALCGQRPMRKRLSAPGLLLNLTKEPGDDGASPTHSVPSSPGGSSDLEVDELETPSDSEQLDSGHEFEWEGGKDT